jgi:hypothetical protein
VSILDSLGPILAPHAKELDKRFHILCGKLDKLIDAVQESSDDPTFVDIYRRQSVVALNGTQSLGKVPPGEFWIIDYVSADTAGWTIKNDAYVILWSVTNSTQNYNAPVALPGDEIYFVTTAPTNAMVQLTRRPLPHNPPPTRTGHSAERTGGITAGSGPAHEPARDVIDAEVAGLPSIR